MEGKISLPPVCGHTSEHTSTFTLTFCHFSQYDVNAKLTQITYKKKKKEHFINPKVRLPQPSHIKHKNSRCETKYCKKAK